MQRYHVKDTGPMAGAFEPCTARKCAKASLHLNQFELEASRMWLQDQSDGHYVHIYQVGLTEAMQALASHNFGELVTAAQLLKDAEPDPYVYTRRGLLQRIGSFGR